MISKLAKQTLINFNSSDWFKLVQDLLESNPINLVISFPTDDYPSDKIIYLYEQVDKDRINKVKLENTLVALFEYYRQNNSRNSELYELMLVFQNIKPIRHYSRFELYITREDLINTYHNGFNLHYFLLNTIYDWDTDSGIYEYFNGKIGTKQLPEHYQIAIRYLYSTTTNSDLSLYLTKTFTEWDSEETVELIIETFDELVQVKKTAKSLYNWLDDNLEHLKSYSYQYKLFKKQIMVWLSSKNDYYAKNDKYAKAIQNLITIPKMENWNQSNLYSNWKDDADYCMQNSNENFILALEFKKINLYGNE